MYGVSCIPTIYKSLTNPSVEKSIEEIINDRKIEVTTTIDSTSKKVVVLGFNQPVVKYNYGSWLGTQTYISLLTQLESDPSVLGVVLNIDSGGGQVYGTGEIYDFIRNYSKPIVSFTNGYMCSGAYYIAAATKMIIANKRADAIGSIGAYATIIDANGIYEHFGAKVHTIYATKSTAKNSDYRDVIENSEYSGYIKNQLDPIVETFIADMKSVRPQLNETVFKGGTWNGVQSISLGLIDANGTLSTAIEAVIKLSQSSNSNSNINMNTKSLPNVEAVLGLEASLALTENGSYLNEEQLDTIEASLNAATETSANLQTQLDAAATAQTTAVDAVQTQLTEAQNSLNAVTASVDAIMTAAGLTVEGSLNEKLTAIQGKADVFGKSDGETHTIPKATGAGSGSELDALAVAGIDVVAALNN
jgi:signal peptide peptidase SppA